MCFTCLNIKQKEIIFGGLNTMQSPYLCVSADMYVTIESLSALEARGPGTNVSQVI